MIYIQNGPAWRPKVQEILKNDLAQGIIWDPREETLEKVDEIKKEIEKLNNIDNLVDNKWYYKQFQNSELRRLKNLDYIPSNLIDRAFLRDSQQVENCIIKCFEYQNKYNVSKLLLPTIYISNFDVRIIDKMFDMCDFALKYKIDNNITKEVYVSMVVQENAFNNMSEVNNFISDFGNFCSEIDGIHIVLDRDNNDSIRHNFNPTRLTNIMNFNYTLNNAGYKIIYGYCGLESLMLIASGASAISTGWFYSLRKFNRQEKGLELYQGQGKHIKRYTSIKVLQEVKIQDVLINAYPEYKEKVYNVIVGDTELDKHIRNTENLENISSTH